MSIILVIFTTVGLVAGLAIDFFNVEETLQGLLGFNPQYGLMVLVLVFNALTLHWLGFQVGGARKEYGVKYPTLYAIKSENKHADIYNCYQRAHQNSLEGQPAFLTFCFLSVQKFPTVAPLAAFVYILSRYFYALGYYTGDPAKRSRGAFGYLGYLVLLGCSIVYGLDQLNIDLVGLVKQNVTAQ